MQQHDETEETTTLEPELSDDDIVEGRLGEPQAVVVGEGDEDADRLLGQLELEEEKDESVAGAYGTDRQFAEEGKWFDWPKLGPDAQLKVAKTKNARYTELWDKAMRRWGGRTGVIKLSKRIEIIPGIYAKTLFLGLRKVRLAQKGGEWLSEVTRKERVGRNWQERTYTFVLDDEGYLVDTIQNRVRLLQLYAPDLQDELFACGENAQNFRDDDPEVLRGN